MLAEPLIAAASAMLMLAEAQPAQTAAPPAALNALLQCRTVADEAERLRCYDAAAVGFQAATTRGDVLVVDRQQVQRTRRRLFGLPLPDINIFGDGERAVEQPKSVEGEIAGVSFNGERGGWVMTLKDGAVWAQTDNTPLALQPRVGQKVVVNRAALGSYMMRVNRQPGIRVRRVR